VKFGNQCVCVVYSGTIHFRNRGLKSAHLHSMQAWGKMIGPSSWCSECSGSVVGRRNPWCANQCCPRPTTKTALFAGPGPGPGLNSPSVCGFRPGMTFCFFSSHSVDYVNIN
jgi:hypothetical protein